MPKGDRKTWLLVADSAKARLFASDNVADGWTFLRKWENSAARLPDRKQGTAVPTRGHKSGSGARYGVEQPSYKEQAGEMLLKELAGYLNGEGDRDRFDQLVLAAPGRALSVLRDDLHKGVSDRIIAEWDKDLTNMPDQELFTYCRQHLQRS